jgi:hypothetical protein
MNALRALIVHLPKAYTKINTIKNMKTINVLILIALAVSTTSAFARIGETRQEIDKRYGDGKHSDTQRLEGAETIKYHFNNFEIEVVFHDNKSIWEIFHPTRDINSLLKAYADDGHTWHYNDTIHTWERSGNPKYIANAWPGHEDFFCIEDVKAIEAIQDSNLSGTGGF